MIDQTQQLLRLIADKSKVIPLVGAYVASTATGCVVDMGAGQIPAQSLTSYLPEINEQVWVLFVDGTAYMTGPLATKPGQGTVVSVASNLVTLNTAIGQVTVPYAVSVTPSAGQVMKLLWQGGGFAVAAMSTVPAVTNPPAGTDPTTSAHVDSFNAVDAASHNGTSWWSSQVYASDSNLSAWFYGSKISDTIPASAIINRVQVFITADQIQGASPNFALHAYKTRPSGAPTLTSPTAVAVQPGWVDLPLSFGNALKAGAAPYGIGIAHGGASIFRSLTSDGQSGALKITSVY